MSDPLPQDVVRSLPSFASYRSALGSWLASDSDDDVVLHNAGKALCADLRATAIPVEQILVALRASGITPHWASVTGQERAHHRYVGAVTQLLTLCFEGEGRTPGRMQDERRWR